MSRPELGPLAVGDEVFVRFGIRGKMISPAIVVKVGPKWVTLRSKSSNTEWKMLKDRQTTGAGYTSDPSFATAAQLAYDQELAAARSVLDKHGISLRHGAVLAQPEGILLLARLLREGIPD